MPWTAEELEAIRIADEEIERCDLTYGKQSSTLKMGKEE